MKKYLIILFIVLCSFVYASDFNLYPNIDGFPPQQRVESNFAVMHNNYTSPTLRVLLNRDGSIRQLEDAPTTETLISRKFAVITKTGLQMESVESSEIQGSNIYGRKWQIPKNTQILVTQYNEVNGIPDFDNPKTYVLSPTSNTLINIQWIRSDFMPYNIQNPEVE